MFEMNGLNALTANAAWSGVVMLGLLWRLESFVTALGVRPRWLTWVEVTVGLGLLKMLAALLIYAQPGLDADASQLFVKSLYYLLMYSTVLFIPALVECVAALLGQEGSPGRRLLWSIIPAVGLIILTFGVTGLRSMEPIGIDSGYLSLTFAPWAKAGIAVISLLFGLVIVQLSRAPSAKRNQLRFLLGAVYLNVAVIAHDAAVASGALPTPFLSSIAVTVMVIAIVGAGEVLLRETLIQRRRSLFTLEAEAEARAHFLSRVNYQLRRPLSEASDLCELLEAGELDAGQRELLAMIRVSTQSLSEMIEDIIDFDRIDRGEIELNEQPFDPSSLLDEVRDLTTAVMRSYERGDSVKLHVLNQLEAALFLRGDRGRIKQILAHLVGNAVKFTERGSIHIQANSSRLGDGRVELLFQVHDTGPGIPAHARERIFSSFTQAHSGLNRGHGGAGIGLSISQLLARLMRGRVFVESELGTGSSFTLQLILTDVPSERSSEAAVITAGRGQRMLVVGDNLVNQVVMRVNLSRAGYEVITVSRGEEALDWVKRGGVQLIFMDLHLEGQSGRDASVRIRRWEATLSDHQQIPIAMLTADAGQRARLEAHTVDIEQFLVKPVQRLELLRVTSELLAQA